MLVSQICNLGKAFLGNQSDQALERNGYNITHYEVLVNSQKEYKPKYFILVSIDFQKPNNIDFRDFNLVEYDHDKRYDYCRGLISGNGVNISPSINIKWNDMNEKDFKENKSIPSKIVGLSNKIGKIIKKINLDNYNNTYVEKFFNWIFPNQDFDDESFINEIRNKIIDYLIKLKNRNLPKKDLPSLIIFGFKKDSSIQFPGELDEFRKLYLELDTQSKKIEKDISERICFICGKKSSVILPFNWGFFTLDKDSFNIGFQNEKNQNQYLVCSECELYCKEGLNVLETYLKFYAFSIKKGRDTIGVYHYLIPNCLNIDDLRNKIHSIKLLKQEINNKKSEDISKQIENVSYKIERANREKKRELMKFKNELEKKQISFKNNENIWIDLFDILEKFDKINLSFIDLYFRYVDMKQNPPTKEIFNVFFVSKTNIEKLSKCFRDIRKNNQINEFCFWWLKDLVENSNYFYYLEALYNDDKIRYKDFVKLSYQNLKRNFKEKVFLNKTTYFRNKIKNFKVFYDLFENAGILENI